jgi:serine protease Do
VRQARLLSITAAVVLLGCTRSESSAAQSSAQQLTQTRRDAGVVSESRRTAITKAVERVTPAVVTVQTEARERAPVDPFDWFFGGRGGGSRVVPGLGTGFIVADDGVIVTNAHVVANADRISVMQRDGTVSPATLMGTDETNDIAVIRIQGKGLPVVTLGNSTDVMIGEWAIAIGNPFGFVLGNSEPTVTAGVVSGVGRNLVARGDGPGSYLDMIQTDASINPGNSGGPLVNADGEVIGVNSSIYTPSGGSVGIGFAIPINRVRRVVEDLVAHGSVRRPWIGVRLRSADATNVRDAIAAGAVIASVTPGSPAASADLRAGDAILRAGDRAIRNPYDWEAVLLDLRVGERIPLRVKRGAREFDVSVTVQDLPEVTAPRVQVLRELELVTLTATIRAERRVRVDRGAVIVRVGQSVADQLGIQTGDVIYRINNTVVASAQEVQSAMESARNGDITMFFERGGRTAWTSFRISR